MKKLSTYFGILLYFGLLPFTIKTNDLVGSYDKLPAELQELSITYGAAAWKTKMIQRLYSPKISLDSIDNLNKPAIKLNQAFFYKITSSGYIGLSKKLYQDNKTTLNPDFLLKLFNCLVYSYIDEKIGNNKTQEALDKQFQEINFPKRHSIVQFKNASPFIRKLILLTALWFYKSEIKNFNYEMILKEKLVKACKEFIKEKDFSKKDQEKILIIQNNAQSIKMEKPGKQSEIEKQIIENLNKISQRTKHPELLKQLFDIKIKIDGNETDAYPNCIEVLLLNLFNLLAYEKKTQTFSIKNFSNIPGASPQQKLIEFYKKFPSIDKQMDITAYQEWSKLVSNIPLVQYRHASLHAAKKNYNIVSSWLNLLLIVNHLLGLHWFDTLPEYPEDEVSIASMVQQNLPSFLKIISRSYENETNTNDDEDNKTIKTTITGDYGQITISYKDFSYMINIANDDGYLEYLNTAKIEPPTINQKTLEKNPIFWILIPITSWEDTNFLPPNPIYLFANPIDKENFIEKIYETVKSINYKYLQVILELIDKKIPNTNNNKTVIRLKTYTKFLTSGGLNTIPRKHKEKLLEKIFEITKQASSNKYAKIKEAAFQTLTALFLNQYKQEYAPAILQIAKDHFQDFNSWKWRANIVSLLRPLVVNNYEKAYDFTKQVAQEILRNQPIQAKKASAELFIALLEKNYAFTEATEALNVISKNNKTELKKTIEKLTDLLTSKKTIALTKSKIDLAES